MSSAGADSAEVGPQGPVDLPDQIALQASDGLLLGLTLGYTAPGGVSTEAFE
jgi:hypothetical protein